ncbi:MAG: HEAT repeat domain-containing protein [Planctomycetes bacterium]|nr:HEAT repeat domain-containing protein [Planctomycetota bacterium]
MVRGPMLAWLILAAPVAPAALAAPAADAAGDAAFEEAVDRAIDRGVRFLLEDIRKSDWIRKDNYRQGHLAIQLYALLKSDVSIHHPLIQEGLERLRDSSHQRTYSVSLTAMAYDAAMRQIETDLQMLAAVRGGASMTGPLRKAYNEFRDGLEGAVMWLVNARLTGRGCWNYGPPANRADIATHRFDHSNTQFAVLGLGVGVERGVKIPRECMMEIFEHFILTQEIDGPVVETIPRFVPPPQGDAKGTGRTAVRERRPDAPEQIYGREGPTPKARGWAYQAIGQEGRNATWNMTCAGQSSLLVARRFLLRDRTFLPTKREILDRAIRDGYAWIIRNRGGLPGGPMYYYAIYSIEKVGDIGEVEAFGTYDWYHEEARKLIDKQRADGSWYDGDLLGDHDHVRYQTSFALLFLNRASADILGGLGRSGRPIIRTGGGRHTEDRSWVYVPRLEGQISVRRIVRKLAYNPSPGIVTLANEVIERYEPEYRGELVPLFLPLRDSPYEGVKKLLFNLLEDVTGLAETDLAAYERWAKDWGEIQRIGEGKRAGEAAVLRRILGQSESLPLKVRAIWAIEQVRDREAIPLLIAELRADDAAYRERAYGALRFISDHDLPFRAKGSASDREAQIQAWERWWADRKR